MSVVRNFITDEIPHLRRYALFLSRDAVHAEDLVQDCVALAIERADQFRPDKSLRPWLFTILRNLFFNQRRRQKNAPVTDEDAGTQANAAVSASQEAQIQLRELSEALDRLSADHRDVIVMVIVEGFSYEEAAQILNVPIGTIRSRLARARLGLQRELGHNVSVNGQGYRMDGQSGA